MSSGTSNDEGTNYQISSGEATDIRLFFEEVQKHRAQIHRQNMSKRISMV